MIIDALKAAAPEWTFEQIRFVAGRCGAVEDDIYNRSSGRRYYNRRPKLGYIDVVCEYRCTYSSTVRVALPPPSRRPLSSSEGEEGRSCLKGN